MVEGRPASGVCLVEVELELGPGTLIIAQERRCLERKVAESVVELAIAHARDFAVPGRPPAMPRLPGEFSEAYAAVREAP